jgi:hypothetical protein
LLVWAQRVGQVLSVVDALIIARRGLYR